MDLELVKIVPVLNNLVLGEKKMQGKPIHGGNVYKAAKELNIPYEQILDFSANINPLGFAPIVEEIIMEHIKDIIYYPDVEQNELKEAAASYYNTSPKNLMPGNGSVELINIILEALRPSKTIIPSPTFSEYALSCESRNIETVFVNMRTNDFRFDLELFDNIKGKITQNSLFIICNPNNPTGKLVRKEDLAIILRELQNKKSYLMLDEAFMDFVDKDESMVSYIEEHDNLIILKSVTKFFALAGLRLGFVLANQKLIKRFYDLKDPWNINTFAGFVGSKVMSDKPYIDRTRQYILLEKRRLWGNLKDIPGLEPLFPEANFVFVKITKDEKISTLAEKLKKKGILIRDCSNYMFLDDSFFRVAVKSREDNDVLISALKEIMNP
ncbi:Threonine-phosphate decarboxylase [Tepidanaerobacter acetatoxydans Re1]|uniref:threonine-phosphate decarboxylase n=2 Tax=Tepidanaerobacter acetatoxydans TaxID=499229 RepID=F4LRT3_TEPAE|nr:Threonine-phosphate decarboxylase [Tepidanaerobacter acetatoxydans Re1]CDI40572.1 Threonine-phosphate decarboxylase [Tepidanaerobacter acetatoxydans Re1]